MATHLSLNVASGMGSTSTMFTDELHNKAKLRISTIYEPSMRDPIDLMFLSGSFHPEFFLQHDTEDSPLVQKTIFAELEDTSDVVPIRRGANVRRSWSITGHTSSRPIGLSKLVRPKSSASLNAIPATIPIETICPRPVPEPVPISVTQESTSELQQRLARLEAESTRLKSQNAQLSSEVQEWKKRHRPSLSVNTKTQQKPASSRGGRDSSGYNLPHTPTSLEKSSLDLPKPLQSNPYIPLAIKHPLPELTPPPSPDSAQTPVLLEISTAKAQLIQSISGPIRGTVTRHQVNHDGFTAGATKSNATIPLAEAHLRADVVPTSLRAGLQAASRPSTSGTPRSRDCSVGHACSIVSDTQDSRKRRKKIGGLFKFMRRGESSRGS